MTFVVGAILFDHQRGQPNAYTVPLRFDGVQPLLPPEWRRGQPVPSVAAYAIDRLAASVSVYVSLAASPDEPRRIEVRAVAEPMPGGFLPPAPLLGDLGPEMIAFDGAGFSDWHSFSFDAAALAAGVDIASIQWRWQCRRPGEDAWSDFDVTGHKVYAVISQPTEPWLVSPAIPSNRSLPRTDMLDFACLWARGARNATEAATRITQAVNRLGGSTLDYDALVGAPHYTVLGIPFFLCDAFLDRLRGGFGLGPLVNCSDCATIVSTFANLVGADLWQSKMGLLGPGFRLNPILAIGSSQWSTLFGIFGFHEVAWAASCTEDDLVFDACVSLDRDADPTRAPHSPELPAGERFGRPGDRQYRDRIAAPDARDACAPQPSLRVRRPVDRAVALVQMLPASLQRSIAKRIKLDGKAPVPDAVRFENFAWFGGELAGWSLSDLAVIDAPGPSRALIANVPARAKVGLHARVVVSVWRSGRHSSALLRVESIESESAAEARRMLMEVAADIQHPGLEPWDRGIEGEAALSLPDGGLALFTRGNHLHVVRSAGRQPIDVRGDAEKIDCWLMEAGTAEAGPAAAAKPAGPRWSRWMRDAPAAFDGPPGQPPEPGGRRYVVTPLDARDWRGHEVTRQADR